MTLGPLCNKTLMTNEDIYLGSSQVVRLVTVYLYQTYQHIIYVPVEGSMQTSLEVT